MTLGPIFSREMDAAARGRRLYAVRALAAAAIGGYVARELSRDWSRGLAGTPGRLAWLALVAFRSFVEAQFFVVMVLVPALVAGAVAEEKARGTLGLLLASRLSSAEIVGGKLAARLLLGMVLVVAGLPVLALVGMLGGIDPSLVLLAYGMTIGSAWMAAALAMLASVHARSAAGATVGAYAAMGVWLVLPVFLVRQIGPPPGPIDWLRPALTTLARSSTMSLMYPREIWGGAPAASPGRFAEMVALQAGMGLAVFALTAWRLRPVERARLGAGPARRWRVRTSRAFGLGAGPRPPVDDDPMRWKERHAPEAAWVARLVVLLTMAAIACGMVLMLWIYLASSHDNLDYQAMAELFEHGLDVGPGGRNAAHRNGLNYTFTGAAAILYTASMVASAVLAASGVAGERGRDTWTALLCTPLDRASIVRAKMLGAVWAVRVPMGMIAFFYLLGLVSTTMHPVGFGLGLAAVGSFVWMGVALGTYVSIRSKDATRAIGRTVAILVAINLAPALGMAAGFGVGLIFCTPMLMTELPISRMRFAMLGQMVRIEPSSWLIVAAALGVVAGHAVAAWLLTRASARRVCIPGH